MCRDVTVCFEEGGEDLLDGACKYTNLVVYEVCKKFGIYSCVDFLDDGEFNKVANVEFTYGFLV